MTTTQFTGSSGRSSTMPSIHDLFLETLGAAADTFSGLVEMKAPKGQVAQAKQSDSSWDPLTRSWAGEAGLRYRVPLVDVPGEAHTRNKVRNIRVLLDNVRRLCVNDLLPCTQEEKVFWTKYRFLKYQLFLAPFFMTLPFTYALTKAAFNRLPRILRGRLLAVAMSASFAELWNEATFPAHAFLASALQARTPLGDAARADWYRLQPYTIPPTVFAAYNFRLFIGNPMEELAFGGNVGSLLG